jgi:CDP-diacylglycerol--glycerol-3-phosphate 3-phosphatidyltransferase/cardiolipin synthase
MLLYHDPLGYFQPRVVGGWLIWLAAGLTLISMAYYLKLALPQALAQDRSKQD